MIQKRFDIKNPFENGGAIYDYATLESLAEFKQLVKDATVIAAVSLDGKKSGILYGTETLRAISARVIPRQLMQAVVFAIGFDSTATPPLEHLAAAVTFAKGYHEWTK